MFDIAFSELLLIGVVALVVIGPERLPKVARTMGHLFGRLQRYVAQVKTDINREMELSELSKVKSEFEGAAREFQRDIETKVSEAERDIRAVETDIERQLHGDAAAAPAPAAAAPPEQAPAAALPDAAPQPQGSPQLELAIDEPRPGGGPGAA